MSNELPPLSGPVDASGEPACSVCQVRTLYACADCRIDFGVSIPVCSKPTCRDEHEQKCSARLRERLAAAAVPSSPAQERVVDNGPTYERVTPEEIMAGLGAELIDPSSEDGQRMIRNSAFEQPLTQGDPPPEGPEDWTRQRIEDALRAPDPNITIEDGRWLLERVRASSPAQEPQQKVRAALEKVLRSAVPNPNDHPSMFAAWTEAHSLLALIDNPEVLTEALPPSSPVADSPTRCEVCKTFHWRTNKTCWNCVKMAQASAPSPSAGAAKENKP